MSLETLTLTYLGGGDDGEDLEYTMSVLDGVDNRQTKTRSVFRRRGNQRPTICCSASKGCKPTER